jgi:hypothetical protein
MGLVPVISQSETECQYDRCERAGDFLTRTQIRTHAHTYKHINAQTHTIHNTHTHTHTHTHTNTQTHTHNKHASVHARTAKDEFTLISAINALPRGPDMSPVAPEINKSNRNVSIVSSSEQRIQMIGPYRGPADVFFVHIGAGAAHV